MPDLSGRVLTPDRVDAFRVQRVSAALALGGLWGVRLVRVDRRAAGVMAVCGLWTADEVVVANAHGQARRADDRHSAQARRRSRAARRRSRGHASTALEAH